MSKYRATPVTTKSFVTWPLVISAVVAVIIYDLNDRMPIWGLFVCLGIYILGSAVNPDEATRRDEAILVEKDDLL